MSKFKIRAELDGVVKLLELDRGTTLEVGDVKSKLEKLFAVKSVDMRYQFSDGRVQAIYQDFHLQQAIQDCETSRKTKSLTILLKTSDPQRQSAPQPTSTTFTQSSATTKTQSPSKTPAVATSNPSTSTASSAVRFCESCGAKLSPTSRFCSGCGASTTGPSATPVQSTPSTGGSAQPSGNNCAGCNQPINGQGVRALDKPWHKECFCCSLCKTSLMGGSFIDDDHGRPLCLSCFESNYAQKCAKCNKPIDGAYVSVEGKDYHKSCFICQNCGGPFDGGYFVKGGRSLCKKCV